MDGAGRAKPYRGFESLPIRQMRLILFKFFARGAFDPRINPQRARSSKWRIYRALVQSNRILATSFASYWGRVLRIAPSVLWESWGGGPISPVSGETICLDDASRPKIQSDNRRISAISFSACARFVTNLATSEAISETATVAGPRRGVRLDSSNDF